MTDLPNLPPTTIEDVLRKLARKEFWNGFETTDEDSAKDYAPDIDEAKQALNALILAEFTELIQPIDNHASPLIEAYMQKNNVFKIAPVGALRIGLNELRAAAQRKYGGQDD